MATAELGREHREQRGAPFTREMRDQVDWVNVGDLERMLSVAGGAGLMVYGLARGSLGGVGLAVLGSSLVYRGATGHCPALAALGLNTARGQAPATAVRAGHGYKIEKAVTIQRPAEFLYRYWRNLDNLPHIMRHLKEVRVHDDRRSHWIVEAPLGRTVEWDAEIHIERDNELIGWRSLPGADVDTAGSVHFTELPGGRGTEVRVSLKYDPPAGKLGANLAWLFGKDAETEVDEDLDRFKHMMEAGESPTTAGQPRGRCR